MCGSVMCVVATYEIMHVIVYFGVCKCMVVVATYVSGYLIWLCKHILISVCVYICCCSVCNPIAQHTRLVSSNRLCYYRSSHTFLITYLFVTYHTHLVKLNHFCCLISMQTVHLSEPHVVYCTHLDLADRFFCVS